MNSHIALVSSVLFSFFFMPMVASAAALDGKTVEFQYLFPTITSNYSNADNGNKLVGAGVEVSNAVDGLATMDISDTNLFVDFTTNGSFSPLPFNGFRITDIFGTIPSFTGVTINPDTNMFGLVSSRITYDDDHIWVNWEGLDFGADSVVSLDITIPEPSTAILLTLGGASVGWYRRRRAE